MSKPQIIYAEISKKQLHQIEIEGSLQFCFPEGVDMKRKWGSRGFTLTCDNEDVSDTLVDGLDSTDISWQSVEDFPEDAGENETLWSGKKSF